MVFKKERKRNGYLIDVYQSTSLGVIDNGDINKIAKDNIDSSIPNS